MGAHEIWFSLRFPKNVWTKLSSDRDADSQRSQLEFAEFAANLFAAQIRHEFGVKFRVLRIRSEFGLRIRRRQVPAAARALF